MLIDFIERRREREKHGCEREASTPVSSHAHPDWGPNPQPRHVPQPGIEPVTFWFMGQHPNQPHHTGQGPTRF